MSLITQCPACTTMFRVVQDQLRISEGWVRCGQCDEVFDANAHLRILDKSAVPLAKSAPTQRPPVVPPAPTVQQAPAEPEQAYDWGTVLPPQQTDEAVPQSQGFAVPMGAPEWHHAPAVEPQFDVPVSELAALEKQPSLETDAFLQQNPHALQSEHDGLLDPEPMLPLEERSRPEVSPAAAFAMPARDMASEADQVPPSFMASAKSSGNATARSAASVLWVLGVLLALLLPLQFLLQNRDHLASTAPALRPLLVTACEWLACSISAPQQIEAIAIESSAFTGVKPGTYVLSVSLKNSAPIELATPALELTLTDRQDRPIVRRVLLPQQWGGALQMKAGSEASASVPISATDDAAVPKIAGYKLLAFYP